MFTKAFSAVVTMLLIVEQLKDVARTTADVKAQLLVETVDTDHEVRIIVH